MKVIAIDTEYDEHKIPFIATTVDEQLRSRIYRLDNQSERDKLKQVCESPNIRKVFHQVVADKYALSNIGIRVVRPYECTMIQASLINENFARLALKDLARRFLNEKTIEEKKLKTVINVLKKKAKKEDREFSWRDIPREYIEPYAKKDPEYTIKLFFLWKNAIKQFQQMYDFELSLVPVVSQMQRNGMRIDRKFVRGQKDFYAKCIEFLFLKMKLYLLEKKIHLDKEFNPKSNPQLGQILPALKLPLHKQTKRGAFSTDAGVLQELKQYEFVKLLLQYRFYSKHHNTYYRPLLNKYTSNENDIAHFDFYQSGARTGRFSAELIQTFPKPEESKRVDKKHEVRYSVCVKTGELIVCIDCDQIEMRIFADRSKSERMINGFLRGVDPYIVIARDLFGQKFMERSDQLKKGLRWVGKKIGLAGIYGLGDEKLVLTLALEMPNQVDEATNKEINMTRSRAEQVLRDFQKLYPVKEYIRDRIRQVHRTGVLRVDIESSRVSIHREYRVPQHLAYKAANMEIQGAAAYHLKFSMLRVAKLIRRMAWERLVKLRACVHDELINTVPNDMKAETRIRSLMEQIEDKETYKVPITVSSKISKKSWGAVRDWDGKEKLSRFLLAEAA